MYAVNAAVQQHNAMLYTELATKDTYKPTTRPLASFVPNCGWHPAPRASLILLPEIGLKNSHFCQPGTVLSYTPRWHAASARGGSLADQGTEEPAARPLATCVVNCGWHRAAREGPNPVNVLADLQSFDCLLHTSWHWCSSTMPCL